MIEAKWHILVLRLLVAILERLVHGDKILNAKTNKSHEKLLTKANDTIEVSRW